MSNKKAVFISTTIAVIILVVIIVAAFFLYTTQQNQSQIILVQQEEQEEPTNIEVIEIEIPEIDEIEEVDEIPTIEIAEPEEIIEPEEVDEIEEIEELEESEELEEDDETAETNETAIFTAEPIPTAIINLIYGGSFVTNNYISLEDLSYLTVTHIDFNGETQIGNMIVAEHLADEVLEIFREIYESEFPIHQIRLIDYYNADDLFSMENNNSSAFNFRYIAETTTLSNHAFGVAIDINPVQNPSVATVVWPPAGTAFVNRNNVRPGMIISGDAVHTAFTSRGWTWGGDWDSVRDYQHFEK